MKYFIYLLFSFVVFSGQSQVVFEKTEHDFDELYNFSDRFVDIKLTNRNKQREFVLSVKKDREIVYVYTGQQIQPDSSVTLRFQVNPQEKGRFNYKVEVFTSDRMEPVIVKLKGEMVEEPERLGANFQSCPTFGQRAVGVDPTAFDMTIVLVDKESKKPISKGYVSLLQNGREIGTFKSAKNGRIEERMPLGFTYFYAQHPGYKTEELGGYVNFKRNYLVIEMEPEVLVAENEPIEIIEEKDPDLVIDMSENDSVSTKVNINLEEQLVKAGPAQNIPRELSALDPNDFSSEYFKPVNVVFVLDVSSSMRNSSKMELMKYSLYTLVKMLRPEDRIGIVKYGSKAEVLLTSVSGSQKSQINGEVEKLKAAGMTAGGAGIKMGFRQARKSLLADGVNQVVIITDGAFNKDSKDYKRAMRKYKRYGITMSVVGIKAKEPDVIKMQEAVEVGKGVFIPIETLADAQNNLNQAMRLASYKF
jgi:Ca-activated chloride channel family protein